MFARSCVSLLSLLLLVCGTIAQDGPLTCGYRFQGQTIDLSSMTASKAPDYSVSDNNPTTDYNYEFNVCAASLTTVTSCASESAAICQTLNGQFTATIAKFPSSSQFQMLDANDLSKGIKLEFANGDICNVNQQPRTSRFIFLCTNGSQSFSVEDSSSPCDYAISIYTPLACVAPPRTFSAPPFYVTDASLASGEFTYTPIAHLTDVNNDGFVDLVYSTYRQDTPAQSINSVYLNNGAGWVAGSSPSWKSPVLIDRALSAIQERYRSGQLSEREYSALVLLSAHPTYRASVEVLFRNFGSDASEFMKHALNLAGVAKADLSGGL